LGPEKKRAFVKHEVIEYASNPNNRTQGFRGHKIRLDQKPVLLKTPRFTDHLTTLHFYFVIENLPCNQEKL